MSKSFNASICNECGCEDKRFDEKFGYYCNNCASYDFYYYDKYEDNFTVKLLRDKYKSALKEVSLI